MRLATSTGFPALIALMALCGCDSLVRPSDESRHASFAKIQNSFAGDPRAALRETYMVFSGDSSFEMSAVESGKAGAKFTSTNHNSLHRGLAVALEADGYLLTAGHVLQDRNFVLGWFDGKVALRPARVVYCADHKKSTDVALLKVDGKPDHFTVIGDAPKVGDRAYAVACYYQGKEMGGAIDFAGGKVFEVNQGLAGSSVKLIDADVPLWHGDSGGPLLSDAGRLIGIFTEFNYDWLSFHRRYWTTFFLPDQEFIQGLIAADRAR